LCGDDSYQCGSSKKPIPKDNRLTKNRIADIFAILVSTGFKFENGDDLRPNRLAFLTPITLIPIQLATKPIRPTQKKYS
jgi:hypothetical protein